MAMKIKMKNILGALGALALVLGAGPAPAAEAFKAGLVEVFAQREGPWQQGFLEGPVFDAAGNLWVVEIMAAISAKSRRMANISASSTSPATMAAAPMA
ncbi:MAG: hypothetical protein QGF33_10355 [Alphaproteobacteria bacterium]|nr:hypothetical protein [Alphaproteobacteria bacterium]